MIRKIHTIRQVITWIIDSESKILNQDSNFDLYDKSCILNYISYISPTSQWAWINYNTIQYLKWKNFSTYWNLTKALWKFLRASVVPLALKRFSKSEQLISIWSQCWSACFKNCNRIKMIPYRWIFSESQINFNLKSQAGGWSHWG